MTQGTAPELDTVAGSKLAAYFARIGYASRPAADLPTLRALHEAHVGTIPFENLDVLLGRPVLLDDASLHRKLVEEHRGGYCFEHNLLFLNALNTLGFQAQGLAARVLFGAAHNSPRPRTHMVLLVEAEGQQWLADVGFGGIGLLEPLPILDGYELQLPIVSFRLRRQGPAWLLEAKQGPEWMDLYIFTLEPQERIDYELASYYTSTHPKSIFRHMLTAQKVEREQRIVLRTRELHILRPGREERRRVDSVAEASAVLEEFFGLKIPPGCALPETLFTD